MLLYVVGVGFGGWWRRRRGERKWDGWDGSWEVDDSEGVGEGCGSCWDEGEGKHGMYLAVGWWSCNVSVVTIFFLPSHTTRRWSHHLYRVKFQQRAQLRVRRRASMRGRRWGLGLLGLSMRLMALILVIRAGTRRKIDVSMRTIIHGNIMRRHRSSIFSGCLDIGDR